MAAPRGGVTTEALIQAWPSVLEAVKAQGRVAAIVIGNASLVSLDEAVLTLRFLRQGDVKGFVNSKYEDLLKQVINTMFGINVVVRAVTGGGDAPSGGGRPGPAQPSGMGDSRSASPLAPPAPPPAAAPPAPSSSRPAPESAGPGAAYAPEPGPAGGAGRATGPFGSTGVPSGDLPPLPPPPPPDDEEFDPDDEDMSVSVPNELTGMALVQRELGGQVIAEYDD